MKIGIAIVLIMGLLGFNEIYRGLQDITINWMLVSFILMFGVVTYILIKVYSK